MKSRIWLSSPHMGDEELNFVNEAFVTNWIAPLGPNVNGFEEDLSKYCSVKHAAALSSGTAAIHLALIILGIKQDDEVICSSFTFSASANPILYQHAVPVFVDSEEDTWNMDPSLLEEAIKDRISKGKKPKAIIVVHLYGMPAKMDEILSIAAKYEIPVIEDAAEGLGARYNDKALGSFGDMGVLSFNGNKIITTSGGGALLSENEEYIKKARFLSTQARDDAPHYQHSTIGYNYRMSNILAGIGRGQMKVLNDRVEARRAVYSWYVELLKEYEGIKFQSEPSNCYSNRWLTSAEIVPEKTGITREDIRLALVEEEIETRPLWKPMHLQPIFEGYPMYENGVSARLFENGLCFPSGSNMTDENYERISTSLLKVLGRS